MPGMNWNIRGSVCAFPFSRVILAGMIGNLQSCSGTLPNPCVSGGVDFEFLSELASKMVLLRNLPEIVLASTAHQVQNLLRPLDITPRNGNRISGCTARSGKSRFNGFSLGQYLFFGRASSGNMNFRGIALRTPIENRMNKSR